MKAHEVGICAEISVSDGGFLHICALKDGHTHDHECACGGSMYEEDIDRVKDKDLVKEFK